MPFRSEQSKMWAKRSARVAAQSFSSGSGMPFSQVAFHPFSVDNLLWADEDETGTEEHFSSLVDLIFLEPGVDGGALHWSANSYQI